jgi:hypothetical protein
MDDPHNIPDPNIPEPGTPDAGSREDFADSGNDPNRLAGPEHAAESEALPDCTAARDGARKLQAEQRQNAVDDFLEEQRFAAARRRSFRRNLLVLLLLTLAAFVLTSWILVRVDVPFGIFAAGPQEIVRAQLRALDRGELRPAYDMFSERYRGQVSFDTWHELFVTHWRMFHADVVRAEPPEQAGAKATLEIYLHGADDKDYRARFTLIHTDGRWWIDDVHWTQQANESDLSHI